MTDALETPPPIPAPLPRLAYLYHPRSFPTLSLAEASAGICEILWIVDTSDEEAQTMSTLLKRFGTVIDIAGLTVDECATLIGQSKPDGILALADGLLEKTASIAERLGLKFLSIEAAHLLTDKMAQRDALRIAGLEVPTTMPIQLPLDDSARQKIFADATFPSVLKPRMGEASRNTYRVDSTSELRECLLDLEAHGTPDRDFVLESFIPDAVPHIGGVDFAGYVSVESLVSDNTVSHLAVTGRTPMAEPFRETSAFIPAELSEHHRALVVALAERAVRAVKVTTGCVHTEIKFTPEGPRIIEVNGRIGGHVPDTLVTVTGIEIMPLAMRIALGERITFTCVPTCTKVGFVLHYYAPVGVRRIRAVSGLAALRLCPGVSSVTLNRGPGTEVDWREGSFGHVFAVSGSLAHHDELRELLQLIDSTVHIEGE